MLLSHLSKIFSLLCVLTSCTFSFAQNKKPNIIFILADDLGYGDISCFNGKYQTPHIDRLAAEGRKFTNYYSASPICSPSRVGFLTGMQPAKWNITSFLQKKADNRLCEQDDFLNPGAPSIARILKNAGYATAHFGKWHMGGGRDVDNAPSIGLYGFDEWSSTYESPDPDSMLTATDWIWSDKDSIKRWDRTAYWVDKTLSFLEKNAGRPCFVNLWPDDVHTPWVAGDEQGRYPGKPEEEQSFVNVLKQFDVQIGHLLDGLKKTGADSNTIIVFTSDNGPLPNFRLDRSAGFRGTKLCLYEGGIRMPFIMRWPQKIKKGTADTSSVIAANDLLPSLCRLANAELPENYQGDGQDRSDVLLGTPSVRTKAIFWEYGRNDSSFKYPKDRSPSLAIREGRWKLLMNSGGTQRELYDLHNDKRELSNVIDQHKRSADRLSQKLMNWWKSLPRHGVPQPLSRNIQHGIQGRGPI